MNNYRGFLRYFRSTNWMFLEQFIRIFVALFVGIWVARYLGPSNFGILSYVLALIALLSSIAKLGLDDLVLREIANNSLSKHDELLGTFFWMRVCGAIIIIIPFIGIITFTDFIPLSKYYSFIIFLSVFFQSFEVIFFYFQARVLGKIASISKLIQLSLSSFIKIYLILYESELFWFIAILAFDYISLAVFYTYSLRVNKDLNFFTNFNNNLAKKLLVESLPLIFAGVLVILYTRIDQIMIFYIIGENELGIYSVAAKLSEAFNFVPLIISASLLPAILNAKKININLYQERLTILYSFLSWFALALICIVLIFSTEIINLLFGYAYSGADEILLILTLNSLAVFVGILSNRQLIAERLGNIIFFKSLVAAILNIFLNLKLIPVYGAYGAAIASCISQFSAVYLYDLIDSRLHNQLRLKLKSIFMPWIMFKYFRSLLNEKD